MRALGIAWLVVACAPTEPSVGPPQTFPVSGDSGTEDSDPPDEPSLSFDEAHVLVVPSVAGVTLYDNTGGIARAWTWTELVGPCFGCTGEGASADGDGLLVTWAGTGENQGVARIDAGGAVDFVLDGMSFPHKALRDPSDGALLVVETFEHAVHWFPGAGNSDTVLRTLDAANPDWTQNLPNGAERVDWEGRSYLLLSNRGNGAPQFGRITCWDITTRAAPVLQWSFPESGSLDTPHGPILRRHADQWVLLYAHSYGAPVGGSVGVAVTDDPSVLPAYVADLVPVAPVGPFDFLRGVELTEDGRLWLTDSGPEVNGVGQGRILEAPFPQLVPTGAVGSEDDLVLVDLNDVVERLTRLDNPFEGWLWLPTIALE